MVRLWEGHVFGFIMELEERCRLRGKKRKVAWCGRAKAKKKKKKVKEKRF